MVTDVCRALELAAAGDRRCHIMQVTYHAVDRKTGSLPSPIRKCLQLLNAINFAFKNLQKFLYREWTYRIDT